MLEKSDDDAWIVYRTKFADIYDQSNYGGGLQSFTMRASHKLVEKNSVPPITSATSWKSGPARANMSPLCAIDSTAIR